MATTSLIQVSEIAADKLSEILKEQGEEGGMLRVMVTPSPNGGFQHVLGVETEAKEEDIVIEAFGIRVVIDGESAPLLEGAEIDYVDGLMRLSDQNVEVVDFWLFEKQPTPDTAVAWQHSGSKKAN